MSKRMRKSPKIHHGNVIPRSKNSCNRIIYLDINEKLEERGCPVCRLIRRAEEQMIENILYERVNDPGTRSDLRESLGLCGKHAWMLAHIVKKKYYLDALGPSIIYEDILSSIIKRIENETIPSTGECILCKHASEIEKLYVNGFASCITDRNIIEQYIHGSSILCLHHYTMIRDRIKDTNTKRLFSKVHINKLKRIIENLRRYIQKQDYRTTKPPSSEESTAWIIAIKALKGEPPLGGCY
ncbi:MAG: DUF6062 family protein [Desulfurococcales archaeon]|nr:DUF6062 family protein [Desulfurococcales archaeon]